MSKPRTLTEILEMCKAATPGPWFWHGWQEQHDMNLMSMAPMRPVVFAVQRWGFDGAQLLFRDFKDCVLRPITTWLKYLVPYRKEFREINHPDAIFMAASRTELPRLAGLLRSIMAICAVRCRYAFEPGAMHCKVCPSFDTPLCKIVAAIREAGVLDDATD